MPPALCYRRSVPELRFLRRFLDQLPGDAETATTSRQVHGALWSRVAPTPVAAPRLLAWSRPLAAELGLTERMQAADAAAVFGGNALWPGMDPYAANYGGHQFGNWAGQLGDGRAIVLGELLGPDGRIHELQLKGAGPTAYSRRGDGRAVLRSSIREFLCSEAMHALGVPTTRALSLVGTGDDVVRDMFYDGRPAAEPGAIVCRVAPTFLRFGNYELPSSRGDQALLAKLLDRTLAWHFPQLGAPGPDSYAALLHEVAERTARLIAHWQAVGFVHGVMNTDNMSILGLTIDYGPYGWIDDFDLGWTPNTTDAGQRRYAFGNQPGVGLWNVARLGEALSPLLAGDHVVEAALEHYRTVFGEAATHRYCSKLGLAYEGERGDGELLQALFEWLSKAPIDMTLFFRALAPLLIDDAPPAKLPPSIAACFYGPVADEHVMAGRAWLARWWQRARSGSDPRAVAAKMDAVNPKYVLRNWLAQEAIDAAHAGDLGKVHRLLDVLQRPFADQPEHADLAQKRPEWARNKPGCSALSCSS
jgi:serine/tyrosine/threonine adenylyltransferase